VLLHSFVCPTEIIEFEGARAKFESLGTQLVFLSCDTPETNAVFVKTPRERGGLGGLASPLVSDVTRDISARYGILQKKNGVCQRGLFIIDPDGVLQVSGGGGGFGASTAPPLNHRDMPTFFLSFIINPTVLLCEPGHGGPVAGRNFAAVAGAAVHAGAWGGLSGLVEAGPEE
jgi:hypothetical protein